MNIDVFYKYFARSLFLVALAILAVGFVELAANLFGSSVLGGGYTAGRMIEVSAALVIFVIAVLLRQIRDGRNDQGGD
jgi:hypothetical protein